MTQTPESAAEIRAALEAAENRLAALEERHEAAAERERTARAERAAKLVEDAGSYRPELAAEVDAAEAERTALAEAIEAARAAIATLEARRPDAERHEAEENALRLRAEAVAAWEALDAELMKHASGLLKLYDAAKTARHEYHRAAERCSRGFPPPPIPAGVEYTMHHARDYLSGDARRRAEEDAERERHRRESEEREREARARQREAEEAARQAAYDALPEAEKRRREIERARYAFTVHPGL